MKLKRVLAIILIVTLVSGLIPSGVTADDESDVYGTVEAISDGITFLNGVTVGAEVEATFAAALQQDGEKGWCAGLKMIAPDGYDAEKAVFKGAGDEIATSFEANKKTDENGVSYVELWSTVTADLLKEACKDDGLCSYTWTFDWDGNGENEQTVTLHMDPYRTVLMAGEETAYTYTYGTVEGITEGITFADDVKNAAEVKATYTGTLQKDADNGWRVGLELTAPEHYNTTYARYKLDDSAAVNIADADDSKTGTNVKLWAQLDPTTLAEKNTFVWAIYWDSRDEAVQVITLTVDPANTVLMEGTVQRYPANLGTVESYTGSEVVIDGNGTGAVTVTVNKADLVWHAADQSIGRTESGWWAGIKVTVPESLKDENSEEVLEKIKLQEKGDSWEATTEELSFYDCKDSSGAPHYVQLWSRIMPEDKKDSTAVTKEYRFNWDGDEDYDQYITFTLVCSGMNLQMTGTEPIVESTKAYVDSYGKTQVQCTVKNTHELVTVKAGETEMTLSESGSYTATLDNALETVTITAADEYGNTGTAENVKVQPKLEVTLTPSKPIVSKDKTHYYNKENPLSFTYKISGDDNGDYAATAKLYIGGKEVDAIDCEEVGSEKNDAIDGIYTVTADCKLSDIEVKVKDATGRTVTASLTETYLLDTTAPDVAVKASENVKGFYSNGEETFVILNEPVKNNSKMEEQNVSFTVTVTDTNLNPELYKTDGWEISGNSAKRTFAVSVGVNKVESLPLEFQAVDMACNEGASLEFQVTEDGTGVLLESVEGSYSQKIFVDRCAPGVDADGVPTITWNPDASAKGSYAEDFEITVSIQDEGAGVENVTYNLEDKSGNGAVDQIATVPSQNAAGQYVIPVKINDNRDSDMVWITVIASDHVGNQYAFYKNIAVDKKDPVVELAEGKVSVEGRTAYYDGNGATFLFSVSELSDYTLSWALDDGADSTFLKVSTVKVNDYVTVTVTVREGAVNEKEAELTLTATDVHGREGSCTISFVVDNKAPAVKLNAKCDTDCVKIDDVNGVDYYEDKVIIDIEVSDYSVPSGEYVVQLEGGDAQTVTFSNTDDDAALEGQITVEDRTVLENIQINVSDVVNNKPNTVTCEGNVSVSFDENLKMSSHKIAVDMTPPEVLVTKTVAEGKEKIQTVDGVDYYNGEVTYTFKVSDQFMEDGTYTIEVKASFESGNTRTVGFNRTDTATKLGDTDIFEGRLTISDGEVLTGITINVVDAAGNKPENISGEEDLRFEKQTDGSFKYVSNVVVVDETAPEVKVVLGDEHYVQTVTVGETTVDYYGENTTYTFTVTDQFMEDGTYTLDVLAFFENQNEPSIVTLSENTVATEQILTDPDVFTGTLTVENGKVLTGITIDVKDAAGKKPEKIDTTAEKAMLSFADEDKDGNKDGIFAYSSNTVVVDKTAPVVTVTMDTVPQEGDPEEGTKGYIQNVSDVYYFDRTVTYTIKVEDQFIENNGWITVLVALKNQKTGAEETRDVTIERITASAGSDGFKVGDKDQFIGFFTVDDGMILKDVIIHVEDGAKHYPEKIATEVKNAGNVELGFFDNKIGAFQCETDDVCVDMTAPTVAISFSEEVVNFYQRDGKNFALVAPVKGESGAEMSGDVTVTMNIAITDLNITLDENVVAPYFVKWLEEKTNGNWIMQLNEKNETVLIYSTEITVAADKIEELPFSLRIYDLAGNTPAAKDVTLAGENPDNGYTLENFAQPNGGIISDTIIIDRRRASNTEGSGTIPQLTLKPSETNLESANAMPLYNSDFNVQVNVTDYDEDGKTTENSAGIQKIEWKIKGISNLNESDGSVPFTNMLSAEYTIPITIATVDGKPVESESNEGVLYVSVTDNAGNVVTQKYNFALDNKAPRVDVEYTAEGANGNAYAPYFNGTRKAKITITDINFDADATNVLMRDGLSHTGKFELVEGNTYSTVVTYAEDGEYNFSMSTTDLAQNISSTKKAGGEVTTEGNVTLGGPEGAEHQFVIDTVKPVINVTYTPANYVDRDDQGVEYFNERRNATVTIVDVNYESDANYTTVTGGDSEVSWVVAADTDLVYTKTFGEGNNYVVDVTTKDKAGNVADPYKSNIFSVDLTVPTIQITSGTMTNAALNIVQDDLVLGFTINDTNENLKSCKVIMQHLDGSFQLVEVSGDAYYTERDSASRTTRYVDITNIAKEKANDGIYIVQIMATDYAGHDVSLTPELYMSLNRFGSSFMISDAATKEFFTGKQNTAIYHNEVAHSLIIQEINPNQVWQSGENREQTGSLITLAFNGLANELQPDDDYKISCEKKGYGENTWYMYTYEIFPENFYSDGQLIDGRYKLLFYSEDDAGNKNTNETNEVSQLTYYDDGATAGTAEFILDHQKPVVSVIGISAGQEISENNQVVEISIADNAAVTAAAYIDGKQITVVPYSGDLSLSENWFAYDEATGKYKLNIVKSNSRQDVKLVFTDAAGNETVHEINDVLVTKNILVQYINSVPALCITAVVLIAAVILIMLLKKKKQKAETK